MIILFSFSSLFYFIFMAWLWRTWSAIDAPRSNKQYKKFSIVIPARNEEKNIQNILNDLERQAYDASLFEIIVVDDHSTDNTSDLIKEFASKTSLSVHVIYNEKGQGKKMAITSALEIAKFNYIITTDADCRLPDSWLNEYSNAFKEGIKMVAAPVCLAGNGWFSRLQMIEYSALMAFGATMISKGSASMCSGANLAFIKQAFIDVKGYEGNLNIPSGDDEFLLYKINKNYPKSIVFLKSKSAIVTTATKSDLISFAHQRSRWTSKWKHHKNRWYQLLVILFFLDSSLATIMSIGLFIDFQWSILGLFFARIVGFSLFLNSSLKFLSCRYFQIQLVVLQIIYPIYVVIVGLNSIFGGYTWKGRKYNDGRGI